MDRKMIKVFILRLSYTVLGIFLKVQSQNTLKRIHTF